MSVDFWQDASPYLWFFPLLCHPEYRLRSFHAEIHDKPKNCCWIVVAQNSFEFVRIVNRIVIRIVIVNRQILRKIVIIISCLDHVSIFNEFY